MSAPVDLIVVGGGPGGSMAAATAAAAGMSVLVLQRAKPNGKTCGGGVDVAYLKATGLLAELEADPSVRINHPTFIVRGGQDRAFDRAIPLPGRTAVFRRTELDAHLLNRARRAGALVRDEDVKAVREIDEGWTVIVAGGERFRARALIGADGANSMVRKHVVGALPREHLALCVVDYVEPRDRERVLVRDCGTKAYLWCIPRIDNASFGIADRYSKSHVETLRRLLTREREAYLPGAVVLRRATGVVPSITSRELYCAPFAARNWALVGDAAGLVHPVTLEGIRYALESGQLAGQAAASGDLVRYEESWRRKWDAHFLAAIRAVQLREQERSSPLPLENQWTRPRSKQPVPH